MIEEALAPYLEVMSPRGLDAVREQLRLSLELHPVLEALVEETRPRENPDQSFELGTKKSGAVSDAALERAKKLYG